MSSSARPRRDAFTLIELLVVIAIIALLASILVPSVQSAKKLAQRAMCQTRYKNLALAASMYINDSADWVPPQQIDYADNPGPHWDDIIMPYVEGGLIIPTAFNGDPFHVGTRRLTPDGMGTDPNGKRFTYSKMLHCPSQGWTYDKKLGTSGCSPYYHYVMYRSYHLTQTAAGSYDAENYTYTPGGVPKTGYRVNEYKNPSQFAFFGEPQVWNSFGGAFSPWWQISGSRSIILDMAAKAVHIGNTNMFATLSGNVFMMTDQEMLALEPVKVTKQYPFYAR